MPLNLHRVVVNGAYGRSYAQDAVTRLVRDIQKIHDYTSQIDIGYVAQGVYLDSFTIHYISLHTALDELAKACGFVWQQDEVGRIHFGLAPEIAAWRAANRVHAFVRCPYCGGGGCYPCQDTGNVFTRTT